MGVQALGYVVIESSDPAKWDTFLTGIVGAMAAGEENGAQLYRIDSRPFRFIVRPGTRDRLDMAGWEVADEEMFERLVGRMERAGRPVERLDPSIRHVKGLARSSDPAGHDFEIFHGGRATVAKFVSPAGVSGFVTGENGHLGMGHIVYGSQDYAACYAFYDDVLGFGDTDLPTIEVGPPGTPPMRIAFMHGGAGRHHSVAVIESPSPPSGCVHIMVEAAEMDDVGRAYDRVRETGYPVSATLGRHVNDEMTSFYVQTPGGFDLEFGCGGLIVDPDSWEPTSHNKISHWGHVWAWQEAMKAGMA